MRFLIADTFAKSVARLDGRARRSVQCAAFGFQMDPCQPSLRLHRLTRARDTGFWSLSVNRDLRIILHRDQSEIVFCYADHHDRAYAWAERRKLGRHPETWALSLVEVAEPGRDGTATSKPRAGEPVREARRPEDVAPPGSPTPALDLQRRLRTRARAAAPLSQPRLAPSSMRAPTHDRPLAQLLQLAQRLGCAPATDPELVASAGLVRGESANQAATPATRWTALHGKALAFSLIVAPWPLLVSAVAWEWVRRGATGGLLLALAPGLMGSLLLALTGVLSARSIGVAVRRALRESERVRDAVRSGRFDVAAAPGCVDPALRPVLRAVHEAVEAFAVPFEEATAALAHVARGEVHAPLRQTYGGAFARQRDAINAIVGFVQLRAEDIRGILGGVGGPRGGAPADRCAAKPESAQAPVARAFVPSLAE